MFDIERILAIPDLEPDHVQCGISGDNRAALKARGFVRKDGTKAKDYMIRTIKKTEAAKAKAEKAVIKGDKPLSDTQERIKTDLLDYLTKTAEIKDREVLKKAASSIRRIADQWGDDSLTSEMLGQNFAPRHHKFLKTIVSRLQALETKNREEYDSQSDPYSKVTDTMVELNKLLPISVNPTESVLESWAAKILDGRATHKEAIAAMTSKKPLLRKK